ncbi:hypothetical protein ACJX0J_024125, partial [Zea mays]
AHFGIGNFIILDIDLYNIIIGNNISDTERFSDLGMEWGLAAHAGPTSPLDLKPLQKDDAAAFSLYLLYLTKMTIEEFVLHGGQIKIHDLLYEYNYHLHLINTST